MGNDKPILLALYSPAPQSGKTTLADHLVLEYGFERVSFAKPLKAMLRALLVESGEDYKTSDHMISGHLKETPSQTLSGQTPRYAMQTLGTTWGRDAMAPELWANISKQKIKRLLNQGQSIVIDDMRFVNEFYMVKNLGGKTLKVLRPSNQRPKNSLGTEGNLDTFVFDYICVNDFDTLEKYDVFLDYFVAKAVRDIRAKADRRI